MTNVRPFDAEDLVEIMQASGIDADEDELFNWGFSREEGGHGYTFTQNGVAYASWGIIDYWDGVGEIWLCMRPEMVNHKMRLVREVHRWLIYLKARGYRRVHCEVLADSEKDKRFAERFGFGVEGYFDRYSWEGKDMIRYVRFLED